MKIRRMCGVALAVGVALGSVPVSQADTWTFQGRLQESGLAAAGPLDLAFRLYDSETLGIQIGTELALPGFAGFGADGTFVVDLDFGVGAFDGADRWLEVWVDGAPLSPRQPIHPTPYAMHAMNVADTAVPFIFSGSNAVFTGGNVGIGTTNPNNALHVAGGDGTSIQLGTNPQLLLTKDLSANKFRIQLAGGGFLGNVLQLGRDDGSHNIAMTGNVGIGTSAPEGPLHVMEGSAGAVTGHFNSSLVLERSTTNYLSILSPDDNERGLLFGDPESFVNGGIIYNASSHPDGFGFRTGNNVTRMVINSDGDVGIGTTTPVNPLHVVANHNSGVVYSENTSSSGQAVVGVAQSATGSTVGVTGRALSSSGAGVYGYAQSLTGTNYGVYGQSASPDGFAGYFVGRGYFSHNVGIGTTSPSSDLHIVGDGFQHTMRITNGGGGSQSNTGLLINSVLGTGRAASFWGSTSEELMKIQNDGTGHAFELVSGGSGDALNVTEVGGGVGVRVSNNATSGSAYGVFSTSASPSGIGVYGQGKLGLYGFSPTGGGGSKGVYGLSSSEGGNGVHGHASNGVGSVGVWGSNSDGGLAGLFDGDVVVSDDFFVSGTKNFIIDNPLNPTEEYLVHSCVESDEMKNVYDGVVTLNAHGEADVTLPEWFGALNGDFRYQLTCVGGYAPVYIAEEINENAFSIAGGQMGLKVSWQVTGVRIDPVARAAEFTAVRPKPERHRGTYLNPSAYGQPAELAERTISLPTEPIEEIEQ